MVNYCLCGCGTEVKNKYVRGHTNIGKHFPWKARRKRPDATIRMLLNNPMFDTTTRRKAGKTRSEGLKNGLIKHYLKGKVYPKHFLGKVGFQRGANNPSRKGPNPFLGKKHTKESIDKIRECRLKQRFQRISKPQLKLFSLVIQKYPQAILEYTCDKYILDIAIIDLKIDIEFDGNYWHDGQEEYDNIRDKRLESLGWKIKRFTYKTLKELEVKYAEDKQIAFNEL